MTRRVAVVTGANRGIGLSVVRKLCKEFDGDVYLTARNTEKGLLAVQKLRQEGYDPLFHQLDITIMKNIREFRKFIDENYHGIDVLVNNAGESYPKDCTIPLPFQASTYVETNFRGTLNMCKLFIPLIRPHGRMVIISSVLGLYKYLGPEVQKRLNVDIMTFNDLEKLADEYLTAVRKNAHQKLGWPDGANQVIKIFQVAMAKIIDRDLQRDNRQNIVVNACCPGRSLLDKNVHYEDIQATDPDTAAEDIVWLALLPPGTATPKGELVQYRKIVPFRE